MGIFGGKKDDDKKEEVVASEETPVVEEKKEVKAPIATATIPVGATEILRRPRVTEKATFQAENGVYVFEVAPRATKQEIKKAVHALYKVHPKKVNIVKNKPMNFISRMRGRKGQKAGLKKAYVYLNEGDRIELV